MRAKDIGANEIEIRSRNRGFKCNIYSIWGNGLVGLGRAAANYLIPDGINLHRQKFGPVPGPALHPATHPSLIRCRQTGLQIMFDMTAAVFSRRQSSNAVNSPSSATSSSTKKSKRASSSPTSGMPTTASLDLHYLPDDKPVFACHSCSKVVVSVFA